MSLSKEEMLVELMRLQEAEQRVIDYLLEVFDNQIGAGDTPIDFLIASHRILRYNAIQPKQ